MGGSEGPLKPRGPWWLRAAERLYGVLLRAYPRAFRREWGAELRRLFRRRSVRARREGGRVGLAVWWGRTCLDLFPSLGREWGEVAGRRVRRIREMLNTTGGMGEVTRSVRFAVRRTTRDAAWAIAAVATLALGAGATTGVFSLVYDSLVRPLPFPDADRLGVLSPVDGETGRPSSRFSMPLLEAWVEEAPPGIAIAGHGPTLATVRLPGGTEAVDAAFATSNLLEVLGVDPLLGRSFTHEEGMEDGPRAVALTRDFWIERYGGDRDVLGSTLTIGGEPHTVVAVLGPEVAPLLNGARLVRSTSAVARSPWLWTMKAVVRRPAGTDLADLNARLSELRIDNGAGRLYGGSVTDLREALVGDTRPVLLTFMTVVGGLLLIACVNLTNLFLVRAARLREERGIRTALGASRSRLLGDAVLDGLVVGGAGGTLGLALAWTVRRLVSRWAPAPIPGVGPEGLGWTDVTFALGLAVVVAVTLGISVGGRISPSPAPGRLSRTRGTEGRHLRKVQSTLVVAQIGVTVLLLITSTLLLRTFTDVWRVDPGFDLERVLAVQSILPSPRYSDTTAVKVVAERLERRFEALPDVEDAEPVERLPFVGGVLNARVGVEGSDVEPRFTVRMRVGRGGLAALGVRLLEGRGFRTSDDQTAPPVAVVTQTFADQMLGGERALGRRLLYGDEFPAVTIVGVAADVRLEGLTEPPSATVFVPMSQNGEWSRFLSFVLRTRGPADPTRRASLAVLRDVEPGAAPLAVGSLRRLAWETREMAEPRFRALIVGLLGATSLLLALVGVYGVTAYGVRRRTREIGIRLALGAPEARVLRDVLLNGAALGAVGIAVGIVASWFTVGLLERFLLEVPPRDPWTFLGVSVALFAATFVATLRPARTAARVSPVETLRAE